MALVSRRVVVAGLPGLALGGLSLGAPALAQGFNPGAGPGRASGILDIGTPQMTLGPFYPVIRPADADTDLTRIGRRGPRALGEVIDVAGEVLRADGTTPVTGAVVEVWQAAASGAYNHPSDPNSAPRDPNFQGFARMVTDRLGRFRFRTIKPGPYGARAPHIHFDVIGRHRRLITQMLFEGDPLNATDNVLLAVRSPEARLRGLGRLAPDTPRGDPPLWRYQIVLGGE
jgi:protocatechuate 3,4-dioxygenase, beta subunit